MPAFDILLAFAATVAIFAFVPGPSMLYAAARTMAGGRRAGMMAVLGIHIGAYVHIVAAAAGLSALFHAVPVAYMVVKLAGAAYLVWLGISLFRAKDARPEDVTDGFSKSSSAAFVQSMTVEILNPKTAIFFLAFLPQFVDGAAAFPVWLQLAILGVIVNTMFTVADTMVVVLAGVVITRLKGSSAVRKAMQRAGGGILIGLGAHLALQRT